MRAFASGSFFAGDRTTAEDLQARGLSGMQPPGNFSAQVAHVFEHLEHVISKRLVVLLSPGDRFASPWAIESGAYSRPKSRKAARGP